MVIEVLQCHSMTNVFTLINHLDENTDGLTPGEWGLLIDQCIENVTNVVTIVYSLLCDANTVQPLRLMEGAHHLAFSCW